jgi:hypothetical protein
MPELKLSLDAKTKARKSQKNTYGLTPGPLEINGTCPGCTNGLGGCYFTEGRPTCYAAVLASIRPNVKKVLEHNTDLLLGKSVEEMVEILDNTLKTFKSKEPEGDSHFRLHWAGDIFNRDYAKALSIVMSRHKNITFWTYTRSFDIIDEFANNDNLVFYLSLDMVNYKEGFKAFVDNEWYKNPLRKISFMSKELKDFERSITWAKSEFADNKPFSEWLNKNKISRCPVDEGKLALEFGCMTCKQCLKRGNPLLWFKS